MVTKKEEAGVTKDKRLTKPASRMSKDGSREKSAENRKRNTEETKRLNAETSLLEYRTKLNVNEAIITGLYVTQSSTGTYSGVFLVGNSKDRELVRESIQKLRSKERKLKKRNPSITKLFVIVRSFKLIPPGTINKRKFESDSINGGMKCTSEETTGYGTLGAIITSLNKTAEKVHLGVTCSHVVGTGEELLNVNGNRLGIIVDRKKPGVSSNQELDFDFALAKLDNKELGDPPVGIAINGLKIGKIWPKQVETNNFKSFHKIGATTEKTDARSFKRMAYVDVSTTGSRFHGVFQVKAKNDLVFVKPGDSGSVLLGEKKDDDSYYPCGILFAMAENGKYGLAFDLFSVISRIDEKYRDLLRSHIDSTATRTKRTPKETRK